MSTAMAVWMPMTRVWLIFCPRLPSRTPVELTRVPMVLTSEYRTVGSMDPGCLGQVEAVMKELAFQSGTDPTLKSKERSFDFGGKTKF